MMIINATTKTTLRRRVVDKMCKDPEFLNTVIGVALEEGAIKSTDILSIKETNQLLGVPTPS